MRRPLTILALGLAAAALSCCGKGQYEQATRTVTAPARSGRPRAGGAASRMRALAFARAVNLRAGDVPGLRPESRHQQSSAADKRAAREFALCLGGPVSSQLVEQGSPEFKHAEGVASFGVSSNVTVARSAAVAREELAQLRGPRLKGCLTSYVRRLLSRASLHGARLTDVSVQQGTPPAPGLDGSVGVRVAATIRVRSLPITYDMDILGFRDGPAQVSLVSTGLPVPFPAALQQRLFLLLLARAKAQRP